MKRFLHITAFVFCFFLGGKAQQLFKGVIVDEDSVTSMPFVNVISNSTGNGTMSDNSGKFYLNVAGSDTLLFYFVGYIKLRLPVKSLKTNAKGEALIVMRRMVYNLSTVTVSTFKIKPYEREKMEKVIKESKIRPVNAISSPITAMYMQFSKRGKEQRKLARIFEEVFIQEQVSQKVNPEIVRKLTGDENLDYEKFRKFCYTLSDDYILTHEGYDLYYKIMECYYRWKDEGR